MTYTRKNQGVCSSSTSVTIEDGLIKNIEVAGGCDGNILGLCALLVNTPASDAITRLSNIKCGKKSTSCPDQIALCLTQALDAGK